MGITKRFNGTQLEQELTKPCPLMPDGEWVLVKDTIYYDGENYTHTRESPDGLITLHSSGSSHVYIQTANKKLNILEVRVRIHSSNSNSASPFNVQVPLQGSQGWFIQTSGLQGYQVFPSGNYLATGTTVTCYIYVYVMKTE